MYKSILFFIVSSFVFGCSTRNTAAPGSGISGQLEPFEKEITGWLTAEHCSTYIFGLRIPDERPSEPPGKRVGYLSGSIVIGSAVPNRDASDALFQAIHKDLRATHLVGPRFDVHSTGFPLFGTYPIFGQRCATVRALGVSIYSGAAPAAYSKGTARQWVNLEPTPRMSLARTPPALRCDEIIELLNDGRRTEERLVHLMDRRMIATGTSACLAEYGASKNVVNAAVRGEGQ